MNSQRGIWFQMQLVAAMMLVTRCLIQTLRHIDSMAENDGKTDGFVFLPTMTSSLTHGWNPVCQTWEGA